MITAAMRPATGTNCSTMTRHAGFCLLLLHAPLLAADPQTSNKPTEPTEISFEELVKMEVPIVKAASKYEQRITEAPSSVTIVTSDEVKKYGYRTLADILASAPGLYVSYDRSYSFLGFRGINLGDFYTRNDRVLLLVNGHRINNGLTDGGSIGTEFILDADLIDRVEIIRGPGSSLYGNNAFFGVVNVVTRQGRDLGGTGLEFSGEAASFDTFKGRVTYGHLYTNGLELLLSGTIYDSEGHDTLFYKEFNTTNQNHGVAENADGDYLKSAFGSIGFHGLSLEGGWITREKFDPTAQFGTVFNDPRLRTTDDRGYVSLKFEHQFPDFADVTAQVYYDRQELDGTRPFPGVVYRETQLGEWWGLELQLTKHLWDRHTITFGGEYRNDFEQQDRFSDATTGAVISNVQTNRQNYGIYLETDFAVLTNLHLNAGFRYDQYADYDPAFNPRVALVYNPIGQTVFKAIGATAFRAPNFFEATTAASQGINLKPETISPKYWYLPELVYEQGIGNHFRSSIAAFWNKIDDLITFRNGQYQNLAGAETRGVEAALETFWASGLRSRASYTVQETKDTSTGQVLTDSPHQLGKINVSLPLWKDKVFAGLEILYVSRRTSTRFDPATGAQEPGGDAPGFGLVNFTLFSQNLVKGLELSGSIYNLLDKKYYDPSTPFHQQDVIEQDGRSFRLKLTYRF